ncbi:hypothetical protein D9619_008069 [Psilocybe cf. subviscida]|uniref:DNA recombination and repair protein Rad51-like C-terminal domain-containing protein n=1 Tax=Psilocybe cf. subviscida TaxID=2480587 RepID=A0A8H5AUI4_9AGAR|nr:hypothetical protein D9619_008069 [Psilocybe cf. subviscida]
MNQLPNATTRRSLLSLGLSKHILASLMQNGYETVQDISPATAMSLSSEIKITVSEAEDLLARCASLNAPVLGTSMTQSAAASIVEHSHKLSTRCEPLDQILEGGLARDQVLDISGPPGSPRERIVKGIVSSYAAGGQEIIFLDCQNMVSVSSLMESVKDDALDLVYYTTAHTLPELLIFTQQLPKILKKLPRADVSPSAELDLFPLPKCQRWSPSEELIPFFAQAVVITSQLATKMVNADGTSGNFETGARGIMMPSLGPGYVPSSKTYRVILAPEGLRSGVLKLTSSPKHPEDEPPISVAYSLDSVDMSVVAAP